MVNKYSERITVSPDTKQLLIELKETFLEHNPSFQNVTLTENFLTERAFKYYIGKGYQ